MWSSYRPGRTVETSDHQATTLEVAASDAPVISAVDDRAASDNSSTTAAVEAIPVTPVTQPHVEAASPLSELDGAAPLFAVNDYMPLDIDVDEPLRAIADEIEAAHKANGAGGNATVAAGESIDAVRESTGAARESEDNIEVNEEASRGATTEA